jgi:hypothetical protein
MAMRSRSRTAAGAVGLMGFPQWEAWLRRVRRLASA